MQVRILRKDSTKYLQAQQVNFDSVMSAGKRRYFAPAKSAFPPSMAVTANLDEMAELTFVSEHIEEGFNEVFTALMTL